MEVFNNLVGNNFNHKGYSVALGFFDGVHLAHKAILSTAAELAKKNNLKSFVVTFKKSPRSYFTPNNSCLSLQTLDDKLDMISKTGIDYAYVLDFEDFKSLSATRYLKDILIKNFNPKYIVTGFNHTFGVNRSGNANFLRTNESFGYKYIEVEKIRLNNTLISSTNIKKFVEKGYIKEANALLGYDFNIQGCVQKGMGLARKLGYKTANVFWDNNLVHPPYGVYFGCVEYKGLIYRALINWGKKPTINKDNAPLLETHILDFDKEIYGENIRVYFKAPLREEKKFNNLEELKSAITYDVQSVASLKL